MIYSLADLHHLREARQASVVGSAELMAQARAVGARELAAMRACDVVLTHSPVEAAYLAQAAPGLRVEVVPWTVTVPRQRPASFARRDGLVFVGGFRHAPNPDAVRWLAEAVLPSVWARKPDLRCTIVGPDWPDRVRWLREPRLQVVGHVADLPSVFGRARLSVAPLRFGAGLKGKVLDSLAAGLPCAMTPVAAEGLPLDTPLSDAVATDPAQLAELILRLHADGKFNAACARAGRVLVAEHFSAERVQTALAHALPPFGPSIQEHPELGAPDRPSPRTHTRITRSSIAPNSVIAV